MQAVCSTNAPCVGRGQARLEVQATAVPAHACVLQSLVEEYCTQWWRFSTSRKGQDSTPLPFWNEAIFS